MLHDALIAINKREYQAAFDLLEKNEDSIVTPWLEMALLRLRNWKARELIKKGDINSRFLMVLLILVYLAATVFSYTRAAWVSLVAGFALWIVIKLRIRFEIIAVASAILIGLFFVFQTQIFMELEGNRTKSSGDLEEHVQ